MKMITEKKKIDNKNRKIIFSHKRAIGDLLMMTAGIRDFKLLFPDIKINVDTNYPFIWENNSYLDKSVSKNDPDVEKYNIGYPAVGYSNNMNLHFTQLFLLDMIAMADAHYSLPISLGEFCCAFANGNIGDPALGKDKPEKGVVAKEPFISLKNKYNKFCNSFSRMYGDVHLSEEEKNTNLIKKHHDVEKYWVIAPGGKTDGTTKIWDWRRFQDVIKHFDSKIKFVTIGKKHGHIVEKLENVIDLTGVYDDNPRALFPLVYHSIGCVCGPSFLMHLSAAIPPKYNKERKPCVVIMGGREPTGWIRYTNHQILHTNGVFSCCQSGGCWKSRTEPLNDGKSGDNSLCKFPVDCEGRSIPKCMDSITAKDVIRAIEKYYEGDLYSYDKITTSKSILPIKNQSLSKVSTNTLPEEKVQKTTDIKSIQNTLSDIENLRLKEMGALKTKEINLLGNLNSKGGGEQSLCQIAKVLQEANWKVNLYPFSTVHDNYKDLGLDIMEYNFINMADNMKKGLPLLYYANDTTRKFVDSGEEVVRNSSAVIIGINYVNRPLPTCQWLSDTKKVKAIVFQNREKKGEFLRDSFDLFKDTQMIILFGAIDFTSFLSIKRKKRKSNEDLIVIRHSVADYRKYITEQSKGKGEKIHIWQKHFSKDKDVDFYKKLLKNDGISFEFMEAHKELVDYFKDDKRMKFYKFDEIPVIDFLSKGHIFLYRTSNMWRDNYPRVLAEALASGIPAIVEPRDGTRERVVHGNSGFYACHFDEFNLHLKTLKRKEDLRYDMGMFAKEWAKYNLNPEKWVEVVEGILG